jgi:hypothetical protein
MATRGIGRPLTILLRADNTQLAQGLQTAESKLKEFGKKTEAAARTATLALAGIGAVAYDVIQSASSLNESISKTEVIFGDSAKAIQDWASTADKSLGLSQLAAQEAVSNFATLGQSAGLTGTELTTFSKDLVTLAADLASFNDTSVDEAITALSAGLRGESEPLRRFNVLLSASAVENRALGLNLADTSKELTEQDKVLARNSLIMEQTVKQQGDFARTADSAANLQRTLTNTIENTKAKLGTGLLPVYQQLLATLIPAAEYVAKNSEQIIKVGKVAVITAGSIIALNTAVKLGTIAMQISTTTASGLRLAYLFLATATGKATAAQTLAELSYKNVTIAGRLHTIATNINTAAVKANEIGFKNLTRTLLLNPYTAIIVGLGLAFTALNKYQTAQLNTATGAARAAAQQEVLASRFVGVANAANDASKAVLGTAAATSNAAQESRDAARANGRSQSTYVSLRAQLDALNKLFPDVTDNNKGLSKSAQAAADKLQKEKEALEATTKAFADYASGVKDALAAQFSFQDAFENKGTSSFLESLRSQANAAIAFSGKIAQLVASGLSRGGIDQVLAAGPLVGGQIADELLKGGSGAIGEVNSLVSSVNAITGQTGTAVSSALGGKNGVGNVNITINGAIDPEGVRRSLEKLFQDSARRTGAVSLVGATL